MKLSKVLGAIASCLDSVIRRAAAVAGVALAIMLLFTVGNVIGRFFFHKPLLGTVEFSEMFMVVIAVFAVAYTAMKQGHINIDLLTSRFSRRTQAILSRTAFFLSAGIFGGITYQATMLAIYYTQNLNQSTTVTGVPFAPARIVMALGCLLVCLRLLVDVFPTSPREEKRRGGLSK